ncbi:hypothetical protein pipiens_005207 [Culex pipiens pipiens]|uniref:Uncharacterized protein n=1 Tax=Culex pipiens pipiens TaxID=38569 RepID=A0ABD1CBB4_CULPP
MGQQQSRRKQRAADIRTSLLSYQHDAGYGSAGSWRSEAVHRGVLRNNARRRSEGCCSCCCWVVLLLLVAAFATAWYAWYRAAQAGHQMAVGFPGLEPGRSCANGTAKEMSRAFRAADISSCIHCFTACGKPCGEIGRATAVSCGVCVNGCRGACWGLGSCVAWLARGVVGLCTAIGTLLWCLLAAIGNLLVCLLAVIAQFFVVLLVVGLIAVVGLLGYLYWDPIVHFFDTVRNDTAAYYDKTIEDPSVVQLWNKTEQNYDGAKGKIDELVNHPEVQRVADKTVELYDAAKDQVVDTYEQVRQRESVQSAVNGTMSFFKILKSKIWRF